MTRQIISTIVLILIGCASFSFGLISCKTTNNRQTQEVQSSQGARSAQAEVQSSAGDRARGVLASFLIPSLNADKGVQKALADKSKQVLGVWATLKVTNGVINTIGSNSLSPLDTIMGKLSDMLSFAFSVLLFGKILAMISSYMVFLAIIPICIIIIIIAIWTHKDKKRVQKVILTSILISVVTAITVPAAFHLSSLIENKVLYSDVTSLVSTIEAKGRTAETMGRSVSAARNLGNGVIEDVINYFILFTFVYLVIPILTLLLFIFLTRHLIKMIKNR